MEPRFPRVEAPKVDKGNEEVIEEGITSEFGGGTGINFVAEDGSSLKGCYAPLSYTPEMMPLFFKLAETGMSLFKPRDRELAILGLASVLDVPYVAYCHRIVAAQEGISGEQFDEGMTGNVPAGLSGRDAMFYRLGRILTQLNGPLDDKTWNEAISVMSKVEIVAVVHMIAGYRWVALLEFVNGERRES